MKIFIDVNVFIDVMTKRRGWRRVVDEATARADAQAILKGLHLEPLSQTILDRALSSAGPDLEDNIQIASAESVSANHLITRNKKDFETSQIACLHLKSGSSYAKSSHSKASSRDLPARDPRQSSPHPL